MQSLIGQSALKPQDQLLIKVTDFQKLFKLRNHLQQTFQNWDSTSLKWERLLLWRLGFDFTFFIFTRLVPHRHLLHVKFLHECIMNHYYTASNPCQNFHALQKTRKPLMNTAISLGENKTTPTHLGKSESTNPKEKIVSQSEAPEQNFSFNPNLAYISPPDNYHSKNIHFLF